MLSILMRVLCASASEIYFLRFFCAHAFDAGLGSFWSWAGSLGLCFLFLGGHSRVVFFFFCPSGFQWVRRHRDRVE